jgi:formate-dependent nitrite reductase membrane component NrfD
MLLLHRSISRPLFNRPGLPVLALLAGLALALGAGMCVERLAYAGQRDALRAAAPLLPPDAGPLFAR